MAAMRVHYWAVHWASQTAARTAIHLAVMWVCHWVGCSVAHWEKPKVVSMGTKRADSWASR